MKEEQRSRRDFIKTTLGLTVSLPVISFLNSCQQDEGVTGTLPNLLIQLSDYPELDQPGGAVEKKFQSYNSGVPIIIIRETDTDFLVLSAKCSHQGCTVNLPENSGEDIWCPCHGSKYSFFDGSVTRGPAPRSLKEFAYTADFDAGTLDIDFNAAAMIV